MRKNLQTVLDAFRNGKSSFQGSVWTDGLAVFSYETCLLTVHEGTIYVNATVYSATTSTQQAGIQHMLRQHNYQELSVVTVEGLPRGATRGDLIYIYCGHEA